MAVIAVETVDREGHVPGRRAARRVVPLWQFRSRRHAGVVERRRQPRQGRVALAALRGRRDVIGRLAGAATPSWQCCRFDARGCGRRGWPAARPWWCGNCRSSLVARDVRATLARRRRPVVAREAGTDDLARGRRGSPAATRRGMAGLTGAAGLHVPGSLPVGPHAVVAARAVRGNAVVTESRGGTTTRGRVAVPQLGRGDDVRRRLAGRDRAVVAAREQCRDLRVIDPRCRPPGASSLTGLAARCS